MKSDVPNIKCILIFIRTFSDCIRNKLDADNAPIEYTQAFDFLKDGIINHSLTIKKIKPIYFPEHPMFAKSCVVSYRKPWY